MHPSLKKRGRGCCLENKSFLSSSFPAYLGWSHPSISPFRLGSAWRHGTGENVYFKGKSKVTSEIFLQTCIKGERDHLNVFNSNRKHVLCLQVSIILTITLHLTNLKIKFMPLKFKVSIGTSQKKTWDFSGHTWFSLFVRILIKGCLPF